MLHRSNLSLPVSPAYPLLTPTPAARRDKAAGVAAA
jgi:hypothetical protein